MKTFNKEGLKFIIGTLVAAVTAVLVASIISTSLGTLAEAIRESNANTSSAPASSSISSSQSPSSSSTQTPSSSSSEVVIEIHQVTFNASGGTAVNPATLQVNHGEYILNFPLTTLTNHTFLGWYTGVTPNDVLFTGLMPVVQDMTLFARWQLVVDEEPEIEPGTVTWRVAFNANGGSTVDTIQVADGKTMALPVTTRTGYVFLGWYTGDLPGDVLFTSATPVIRDMTLFARWDRQTFMITFLTYGGSFVAPLTAKADSPITAPANPTRQNYTFVGWYTDIEFFNEFVFDTMPEASITLHAFWSEGTYEGLLYVCGSTECIITGYDGIHSSIYIPAEINELPVTLVADRAFEGNEQLVSITFEDGEGSGSYLKTIGTSAFANMPSLRSVQLPESSLKTIKNDAFRNSSLLTALDIPFGVTSLGTNVLTGADSLERITVRPSNNLVNTASFNFRYLFGGTAFNSVVSVPTSLETIIVPEGTTLIPNDFLRDLPMVKEVVMPSTLTSVGTAVLQGANALTSLTWTFTSSVDAAVNSYLSYAFGATHSAITNVPTTLESVTIHQTNAVRIASYAFYNIASLTYIEIPENITEIAQFAFAHVASTTSKLKYLDLPTNLVTIGNSMLANSGALLEITIPDTVISIGTNVLNGAVSLTKFRGSIDSPLLASRFFRYFFGGTNATTTGVIPTALQTVELTSGTTLANSYFQSFTTIQTVFLPSSLTTLGNNVFNGVTGLKQVQVLGSEAVPDQVILPSSVTTFGTNVFQNATGIKHVTLPSALTTIPADTFNGATNLETVVTGATITAIGNNAFLNSKLSTFTFSPALVTIGSAAFQGTSLTEVLLPNTVTTIGNDAFRNNASLTAITFPSSVPSAAPLFSLGTNVLTGAQVLTTMSFHIDVLPATAANRVVRYFFGGSTTVAGTIPTTLKTLNLTGGTTIYDLFVNNMTGLETINLPSTLTTIGLRSFEGASGVKSLIIPESVNSIANDAFRAMTGLLLLTFLRETLPATVGTNLFATSYTGLIPSNLNPLANLFIVVPSQAAYDAYILNAQFNAFATAAPTRLVIAESEPEQEVILP
jgi:uncharacterized repeat protein (TIGR02543 family)